MKKINFKSLSVLAIASILSLSQSCSSNKPSQSESETKAAAPVLGAVVSLGQVAHKEFESIMKEFDAAAERRAAEGQRASDARGFLSVLSEQVYLDMNLLAAKKNIRPYNIAICDNANRCDLNAAEGLHHFRKSVIFQTRTYTVFGFRAGVLTNNGHNGWDQWIVLGCHDMESGRNQKIVNFRNTSWIGPTKDVKPGCI